MNLEYLYDFKGETNSLPETEARNFLDNVESWEESTEMEEGSSEPSSILRNSHALSESQAQADGTNTGIISQLGVPKVAIGAGIVLAVAAIVAIVISIVKMKTHRSV